MKFLIALVLLASLLALGRAQSQGAASAPGCGASNIEFQVKTAHKQHPTSQPATGKAEVYFLQDDTEFLANPRPTTRFGIDGTWVGATHSNSYFFVSVDPGEHHLCASWQGFVGRVAQRGDAALHFTAEAGNSYYFRARDLYNFETKVPAQVLLKPLDSDEAQLLMSHFSLSTFNPKN